MRFLPVLFTSTAFHLGLMAGMPGFSFDKKNQVLTASRAVTVHLVSGKPGAKHSKTQPMAVAPKLDYKKDTSARASIALPPKASKADVPPVLDRPAAKPTEDLLPPPTADTVEEAPSFSGATDQESGDGNLRLIRDSLTNMNYTEDALESRFEGILMVDVTVDQDGRVIRAHLTNPSGLKLDEHVLAAARNARYEPLSGDLSNETPKVAHLRFDFKLIR